MNSEELEAQIQTAYEKLKDEMSRGDNQNAILAIKEKISFLIEKKKALDAKNTK